MSKYRHRTIILATAFVATGISAAASAQNSSPVAPPQRQASASGQDGQYSVPPPAGYRPEGGRYAGPDRDRDDDDLFSREAERWAAENCIAERRGNAAAGAVIGGLIGALAGSGLADGRDRGPAAVLGAGAGAVAGSSIARNSSPDCPPGYILRRDPQPFYAPPFHPTVVYVAPAWYDPWILYRGHWLYRPYPYHRFWHDRHWRRR